MKDVVRALITALLRSIEPDAASRANADELTRYRKRKAKIANERIKLLVGAMDRLGTILLGGAIVTPLLGGKLPNIQLALWGLVGVVLFGLRGCYSASCGRRNEMDGTLIGWIIPGVGLALGRAAYITAYLTRRNFGKQR